MVIPGPTGNFSVLPNQATKGRLIIGDVVQAS